MIWSFFTDRSKALWNQFASSCLKRKATRKNRNRHQGYGDSDLKTGHAFVYMTCAHFDQLPSCVEQVVTHTAERLSENEDFPTMTHSGHGTMSDLLALALWHRVLYAA